MRLITHIIPALALMSATVALAQSLNGKSERIMFGFEPDMDRLELIKGEALKARFSGRTIAGIYDVTRHDDQRFVETFGKSGSIAYREREFTSSGRWYVEGDRMCFEYVDSSSNPHCFYEFRYGDCFISYSTNQTWLRGGKPNDAARWNAVQRFVDAEFNWPDVPASEADEFACFLSFV